jgi:hypothetical protein
MVYPALLPLMRTPRLPLVERTDAPANLNGLVHFAERRNRVSARVPSDFKRSLPEREREKKNKRAGSCKQETKKISEGCRTVLKKTAQWGLQVYLDYTHNAGVGEFAALSRRLILYRNKYTPKDHCISFPSRAVGNNA